MKTNLLILFFCILCSELNAQQYDFLPTENAHWFIEQNGWFENIPQNPYGVFGDTIINGQTYLNIKQCNDLDWNSSNTSHYCGVRQDGDKWLFKYKNDDIEYLQYDFDVQAGDSLEVFCPIAYVYSNAFVNNIDEIYLGNKCRRRIEIIYSDNEFGELKEYWIEGIGSLNGVFFTSNLAFDAGTWLTKFYENGQLIYAIENNYDTCELNTNNNSFFTVSGICVFPNPTKDYVYFKNDSNITINSVSLIDINGLLLMKKSFLDSSGKISVSHLSEGIYILKVELQNGKEVIKKLIKE